MSRKFKPGGCTSGNAKQINVQDLYDHIEEVIIPSIKKKFEVTEDAEFEVIESRVHDPEGSTLTEIQDVDYGWKETGGPGSMQIQSDIRLFIGSTEIKGAIIT